MTVVAILFTSPEPVMLGDTLVSGSESNPSIPAIGDIENLFPDGHAIAGLCQKIFILNEHCMIGWAGKLVYARGVIQELQLFAETNVLTEAKIQTFLDSLDSETWHHLDLVGLISSTQEGVRRTTAFQRGATKFIGTPDVGEVWAIGEGVEAVKEVITIASGITVAGEDAHQAALHKAWILAGLLLRSEHADGNPIVAFAIGGAYEVATFHQMSFRKVSDVAHISYNVTITTSGKILIGNPMFAMRSHLYSSVVVLRSMRIDANAGTGTATIPNDVNQAVPTVLDYFKARPIVPRLSLNARTTYHLFHILSKQDTGDRVCAVVYLENNDGNSQHLVHFLEPHEGIGFVLRPDFVSRMVDFISTIPNS